MINNLEKKTLYFERFDHLFSEYSCVILVNIINICSNQLKKCRKALGKDSILILGKNKIIKKVLSEHVKKNPELVKLLPYLTGNIAFIFTKIEPIKIKAILEENKIPAPAKAGQKAPADVIIPEGITQIAPDGTAFFQALNIQTKISKGLIEIQNPVKIIIKGDLIGNSEVILLQKLNIVPFSHCLEIKLVYENNCIIQHDILDISMNDIEKIQIEKKNDLKMLESVVPYSNFIKMETQRKKTTLMLIFLSQKLGFISPIKPKHKINENVGSTLPNHDSLSHEHEKIIQKSESDDEDMGFGLFD